MEKVLVVKNIAREGPGLLGKILSERGIGYDVVDADAGEPFPSPVDYAAVCVLGGPDSTNDDTIKMKRELARIKQTVEVGIPYLGVCLGMQALVKAMGGEVYRNPVREVGWRDPDGGYFIIEPAEAGKADPFFSGIAPPYNIFHLHGETVTLPDKMELLAAGKWCENQVVRVKGKPAYGVQGHLELTHEMFEEWLAQDPDLALLDRSSLRADYLSLRQAYEKRGIQALTNFLRIARLI
ncbi:MAG: type 1 glutamine amidotransferase [Candidatus Aenigmarchaeota archaeon]|nr:type 1 glutamine amidotransferase [Candidatus Aenigmarchaeota archaeon]